MEVIVSSSRDGLVVDGSIELVEMVESESTLIELERRANIDVID